uniref:Uncharacterized protein n=1 Tax=Anguilla anguilla TaxID=7936 RepID=A0A0E9RRY6_ANGAN
MQCFTTAHYCEHGLLFKNQSRNLPVMSITSVDVLIFFKKGPLQSLHTGSHYNGADRRHNNHVVKAPNAIVSPAILKQWAHLKNTAHLTWNVWSH